MTQKVTSAFAGILVHVIAACCALEARGREPMAGGFSRVSVTNSEIVAAAAFATGTEEKALRAREESRTAKIELVKIVSAQQQIVAGMNYRLTLKVKLDGREKDAEAVVWWQAWRLPDPYQLTSWTWR